MTKVQERKFDEMYEAVVTVKTVLLGANGDPGLVGEMAILKREHAERGKERGCLASEAIEAHESTHHRAADTRRNTAWDRVQKLGTLAALAVAIAVAIFK